MTQYTFDGTKSTFKNDIAEATIIFKKTSETRVDIQVEIKHYVTNTIATYKKYIATKEDGFLQHYPIKEYAVQGVNVGEFNTIKKYFTHILGEEGYQKFREGFLIEYGKRKELELSMLIGKR